MTARPAAGRGGGGARDPGVGHFGHCVRAIRDSGLDRAVARSGRNRQAGLRSLRGDAGALRTERGGPRDRAGGLARRVAPPPRRRQGAAHRMERRSPGSARTPTSRASPTARRFYFVHSYAPDANDDSVGVTEHGRRFAAAAARDNVFATQFHPEKSGEAGLAIYANFVKAVAGVIVIPAIDLRGGRAVRLRRGDPSAETAYDDIRSRSRSVPGAGGAQAARDRSRRRARRGREPGGREEICRAVVGARPGRRGGPLAGRRSADVLEDGAARAILGTAAAADPSFVGRAVEEFAERVVVAVDVRGGHLMMRRLARGGAGARADACPALNDAGAPRYLVTAIARDGTLDGPDLTLYRQVLKLTDRPVIASGGVRERRGRVGAARRGLRSRGRRQGALREDAEAVAGDQGVKRRCSPSG